MPKQENVDAPTVAEILDRLDEVQCHLQLIREWAMAMQEASE